MISSESSDEEIATLHARQLASVVKPKRVKVKKTKVAVDVPEQDASSKKRELTDPAATDNTNTEELTEEEIAQRQAVKRELRKKRKLEQKQQLAQESLEKEKQEEARVRSTKGRAYTVSIAVPGSVIDNAQTKELKTYLAGQIARAAVIFQVDEIVVFDDQLGAARDGQGPQSKAHDCHVFLNRILQYLETPQYLRRALFPMHSDLSCAGLLNPLDCPHHLRGNEWSVYREGVVTDRPLKDKEGSHVHVGLQREVMVDKRIQPGIRVTVKIDEASKDFKKKSTSVSAPEYCMRRHHWY